MSVVVQVKVSGLQDMHAAILKMPAEVLRESSAAVRAVVRELTNESIKQAPSGKGHTASGKSTTTTKLKQSIRGKMNTLLSGTVYSLAPYALYVHEPTRPHVIVPVNKRVLADKRAGVIYGKRVNHPGTKGNPFFERAVKNKAQFIAQTFKRATVNVLRKLP